MSGSLFVERDGTVQPTEQSRGPWSPDSLHGGPVAADPRPRARVDADGRAQIVGPGLTIEPASRRRSGRTRAMRVNLRSCGAGRKARGGHHHAAARSGRRGSCRTSGTASATTRSTAGCSLEEIYDRPRTRRDPSIENYQTTLSSMSASGGDRSPRTTPSFEHSLTARSRSPRRSSRPGGRDPEFVAEMQRQLQLGRQRRPHVDALRRPGSGERHAARRRPPGHRSDEPGSGRRPGRDRCTSTICSACSPRIDEVDDRSLERANASPDRGR